MAKRFNKKVAIIGSLIVAMLMFGAIVVFLKFGARDPHRYIKDAQTALALKEPDYKTAEKAYGKAFAYAKKNIDLKIDILFKLVDMYKETNEWPKAAGCWNKIINFDTKNLKARLALLDYSYQIATSGNWSLWKDVESNTSELIDKGLDTSPRIYRMKGQALLELAKRGQMTDKEKGINNTILILQKANQSEPNNVDSYEYLAEAITLKGDILAAKGILNADQNARQEAGKIVRKAVENLPKEPKVYIYLYTIELAEAKDDQAKIKKVESELIGLTQKFPESHLSYYALCQFYLRNPKDIEKAIKAVEKSRQIDKQNVSYALTVATLYYRKSLLSNDQQSFQKAIDIANEALTYPDSLDIPGPKARISIMNRYSLHTFLANCYLDKIESLTKEQAKTANWQELAEKEVYQINQILGSAENSYAEMWQGRILLAKGQKNEAIRQMYDAYQKLTSSVAAQSQADPQVAILAYELAKAYSNTPEIGAVGQFYLTAFKNGMYYSKPQMLLDFATSMMRIRDVKHTVELIDLYEKYFDENSRSRELRLSAYIGDNRYEQTQEKLAKLSEDDPNILRLKNLYLNSVITKTAFDITQMPEGQQQSEQYKQLKAKLEQTKTESMRVRDKLANIGIKELSEAEFSDICKRYISDEQYKKAVSFIDNYQLAHPNSVNASVYKLILAEPSPVNVPPERNQEIVLTVFKAVKDPIQREILIGQFYQSKGDKEQSVKQYQKALEIAPDNAEALTYLFGIELADNNFSQAEKLIDIARKNNTDLCDGELFKARLAYAQKDYQTAIDKINICFEKRPISSEAYLLRSQAYGGLNKESDAIADARKAYELNPYDNFIPRNLAYVLYNRNMKLGSSVTVDQIAETRNALETAIRANPTDVNLRNFYAKYISATEPDRAIAVSQQIEKMQPTIENSLWLGTLAMDVAKDKVSTAQKENYYALAQDAYKKAYVMGPNDIRVLNAYSEYFRTVGKPEEGEKILAGHNDLLWRYYARSGKNEEAQKIVEKLYEANPSDTNNIKGLLFIARAKNDNANILKYSSELVKVDKSLDNQIIQIESTLETGLSDEAKAKIESLREKYPTEPRLVFLQTWLTAKQGKLEESMKYANKNLELDAGNPRAWQLRGQINLGLNKFSDAINDFQKSKALSDNADIRVDLARAYAKTNANEQAIAELKVAADEQKSLVARNLLEEMYYRVGNIDRIDKFYTDTVAQFPNDIYWCNHAGSFALKTKNFVKAYNLFDIAFQNSLKINSESPDADAFDGKLQALLNNKKYEQLQAEVTKYLDGPLAPIAYERMAEAKAAGGEKDTAIQYFKRALEKAGTNESYLVGILALMNNVVGYDETLKWCNEKIQSQPDSLAVNIALYNLYNISQQYNKSLEYIEKCIKISSDNEQVQMSCRLNKTKLLLTMFYKTSDKDCLKKVIDEYESILQKQPNNIEIMNNLAYILADNNIDMNKALEYGQKAYQAASNNAGILDTYGYVLFKNGKSQDADEFLYRAVQQYEQNKMNAPIEVYEHLAMVKEKLGQKDKAVEFYKRALDIAGDKVTADVKTRLTTAIQRLAK